MSDLVGKLRQVDAWNYDKAGNVTATYYHNPDGPVAADEIARLTAEVERLQAVVDESQKHSTLINCTIIRREGDPVLFFLNNGIITIHADGYVIMPIEKWDGEVLESRALDGEP